MFGRTCSLHIAKGQRYVFKSGGEGTFSDRTEQKLFLVPPLLSSGGTNKIYKMRNRKSRFNKLRHT